MRSFLPLGLVLLAGGCCFNSTGEGSSTGATSASGPAGTSTAGGTSTGGSGGASSTGGETSTGGTPSTGGTSGGAVLCTADSQCPASGYCNYGVAACDGGIPGDFNVPPGLNTVVPGACEVPDPQGTCSVDADCPSFESCSGGQCQRCPQDAGPPPCRGVNAPLCPPHCVAVPVPHVCYAEVCVCPGFACSPPPTCSSSSDCAGFAHEYACCDGGCVDVSADSANCGGCGTVCPSGTVCTQNGSPQGSCEPPPGSCGPSCGCPPACAADAGGICCVGNGPGGLLCVSSGQSCPPCSP